MEEVLKAIEYGASKDTVFSLLKKNDIEFKYYRVCSLYPNNYLEFNGLKIKNI